MFRDCAGGSHGGVQTRCCAVDAAGRAEVGECVDKQCNVGVLICIGRCDVEIAAPERTPPVDAT